MMILLNRLNKKKKNNFNNLFLDNSKQKRYVTYDPDNPPFYWYPENEEAYNSVFNSGPIPEWEEWGPELTEDFYKMIPTWADISRTPLCPGYYHGMLDPVFIGTIIREKIPLAWQRREEQKIANWADRLEQVPRYFYRFEHMDKWKEDPEAVARVQYLLDHCTVKPFSKWTEEEWFLYRVFRIPDLVFPGKRRSMKPYLPGDNYEFYDWNQFMEVFSKKDWATFIRWHGPNQLGYANFDLFAESMLFWGTMGIITGTVVLHIIFYKECYNHHFGKDPEWDDLNKFGKWINDFFWGTSNSSVNKDILKQDCLNKSEDIQNNNITDNLNKQNEGESKILAPSLINYSFFNDNNSIKDCNNNGLILVEKDSKIDYSESLKQTLELDRLRLIEDLKDKNWKDKRFNNNNEIEEYKFLSRINTYLNKNSSEKKINFELESNLTNNIIEGETSID